MSAVDGGGLGLSGGAGAGGVEVPGQQFGDTTDRMVCDAAVDVVRWWCDLWGVFWLEIIDRSRVATAAAINRAVCLVSGGFCVGEAAQGGESDMEMLGKATVGTT